MFDATAAAAANNSHTRSTPSNDAESHSGRSDVQYVPVFRLKLIPPAICLILLIILPAISHSIQPFQRGLYCDDASIGLPDIGYSTVPVWVLSVAIIAVSACVIFVANFANRKCIHRLHQHAKIYLLGSKVLPLWMYETLKGYVIFVFGLFLSQTITDALKLLAGRQRPYFLDVCRPIGIENCEFGTYLPRDTWQCETEATNPAAIHEAQKSFVSGHSSSAIYTAIFISLYIELRMPVRNYLSYVKKFLQGVIFIAALYVCLSRISDFRHHWSDVLAGAIVGGLSALFVAPLHWVRNVSSLPDKSCCLES